MTTENKTGRGRRSTPVDVHVGKMIRSQRQLAGMSQENLADALGITFQQIQKYEKGANRVSASRLFQLSKALKKPVGWFFEGLDAARGVAPELSRKAVTIAREFDALEDEIQDRLYALVRSIGKGGQSPRESV